MRGSWTTSLLAIPVVDPLAAAVGPAHLGDQQLAPEQVVDGQRGNPALPAGCVGLRPVIRIDGITGIECPGRAYRGLQIVPDDIGHAHDPATVIATPSNPVAPDARSTRSAGFI
jgi:hypothetical protein